MVMTRYQFAKWLVALLLVTCSHVALADVVVRVGVYDNPPKEYVDDAGVARGLFPELVDSIASEEGWTVHYVPGTWTECLERLEAGEIDLLVDVAYSGPRAALYDFTNETVLVNWGIIYARRGLHVLSLVDLQGLRIAVMRDSTHTVDPGGIVDLTERFAITCSFVEADDYAGVFQLLADGKADVGVVNRIFGLQFESKYPVERTPILFNPIELRFALPKDGPLTPYLIDRIDRRLVHLKANPESVYYQALARNLFVSEQPAVVVRWPPWLTPTLASAGALIAALIAAYAVVRREVRQRAIAETALRRNEERFSLAMQGANDGLWDWDIVSGRVEYTPRWMGMLGYAPSDLPSSIETFHSLIHPDDRARVTALEGDYLAGRVDRYEAGFRMRHKDGHYVHILSRAFLVRRETDGSPLRMVGTHVDVTERERAASELEAAKERAEAADHVKSAFLATMSHELRTPLNSIIGFTGMLHQGLAGPLNEEQRKQLSMVRTSARHLLELINDVLDISKIEAGELQVASESFDLRNLVSEVADSAIPMAEKKGLTLHTAISSGVGTIVSDRRRVGQILMNLLSNAVKFTPSGEVRVDCRVEGPWAVLAVTDTGIGIKHEDLSKLFIPFQQIESGLTRTYDGTGLGLSISKRLVTMLGGSIEVESEPGRGSTFTFRLPLQWRTES